MINPNHVPDVDDDEILARFILQRSHVRADQKTLKADPFIPHPYDDLSVTRHRDASEAEVWSLGEQVSQQCQKTLRGRADVKTMTFRAKVLIVRPDPLIENPNHANVSRWPEGKPMQKMLALEIAAAAEFHPYEAGTA